MASKYQRRHYEDVARILAENRPTKRQATAWNCWLSSRADFERLFNEDNDNFDRTRFVVATEV